MGLFGSLFDKKICDICGGEIGLLGNRKLENGNCCKECASLLSPFLTDRRGSTVDEIRAHVAYREANRQQLPCFRVSRVYGASTKIYFDDEAGRFFVTPYSDWIRHNPDIIDWAQVIDCQIEINESRHEDYDRGSDGQRVRFDPPRYHFTYDFYITILVDSLWFDRISFKLSDESADAPFSPLYHEYEKQADEIRMTLLPNAEPQAKYLEPPRPPVMPLGMAAGIIAGRPVGGPQHHVEPPRPQPTPGVPQHHVEPPRPQPQVRSAPQARQPEPPRPQPQVRSAPQTRQPEPPRPQPQMRPAPQARQPEPPRPQQHVGPAPRPSALQPRPAEGRGGEGPERRSGGDGRPVRR